MNKWKHLKTKLSDIFQGHVIIGHLIDKNDQAQYLIDACRQIQLQRPTMPIIEFSDKPEKANVIILLNPLNKKKLPYFLDAYNKLKLPKLILVLGRNIFENDKIENKMLELIPLNSNLTYIPKDFPSLDLLEKGILNLYEKLLITSKEQYDRPGPPKRI